MKLKSSEVILSVIIITKNEEKHIGKCIKSVLEASQHIKNKEVILVDSASVDNTIEIAKKYPIKILQLNNSASLSPSASRYVGFLNSNGRYIHFQDGDSILDKEWFKNSLPFLEKNPEVAGVTGIITQEGYDNLVAKNWIKANNNQKPGEIRYFESFILIKRNVLEKVGSFNPWLIAMEEGELSYRILSNGFKLYRLPCKVSHHLGYDNENVYTFIKRRIISSFVLGQILRYSLKKRNILMWHIRDSKFIVSLTIALMLMFLSSFPILFLNDFKLFYLSIILVLIIYLWILIEKKNILHIISITFRWPFLLFGFLKNPKKPSSYPNNVSVIKS